MTKLSLTNLFVLFSNKQLQLFPLYNPFLSIWFRISWNIGENRNQFLELKSKLGLNHVVLTSPKTFPEKITLTLVEMQQLSKIRKVDSKNGISCLKWTLYNGSRKVCISFKNDMDKLNVVVYLYWSNTYVKETERELKLNEPEKLLSKRVYLLSYIDVLSKRWNVLDETTIHYQSKFHQEWMLSF